MTENLILIGMPGSGKSTVGVLLAKALGYQFIDTDLIISAQQGATLQSIIDNRGLEAFLECEERAGLSVDVKRTVIATGGSMVLKPRAMAHFQAIGTILYLDVSLQTLKRRLKNMKTRGIAAGPDETLEQIYAARERYYRKYADLRIKVTEQDSLEDTVAEAVRLIP